MVASMTAVEQAVRDFDKHARAVESLTTALNEQLSMAPESELHQTLRNLLCAYKNALDDKFNIGAWLEWWWLECDLGGKPKLASIQDEEQRLIVTLDDLVKIVCDDVEQG